MNDDDDKTIISTAAYRLSPGTRLNGVYEIDSLIGIGGMSEIYRGHNIETMDDVAIKVILPQFAHDPAIAGLFRREALILNRLNHEAIIRYHLFTRDPEKDLSYLSMEFVNGPTLRDAMKSRRFSQSESAQMVRMVARGLAAAHAEGIVHRDISTDNIILANGDITTPKIIDFGIARAGEGSDQTILQSGFAGKHSFASPEQLGLHGGEVGPATDIYSLGLVFAASLLGEKLPMGGTHAELVMKRQRVPDLGSINPGVKPVIERMLQPNPADRYANMKEVAAALDFVVAGSATIRDSRRTPANSNGRTMAVTSPAKRRWSPLALLFMLAAMGVGAWYGLTRTESGQRLADQAGLDALLARFAPQDATPVGEPSKTASGKITVKAGDGSTADPAPASPTAPPPDPAPTTVAPDATEIAKPLEPEETTAPVPVNEEPVEPVASQQELALATPPPPPIAAPEKPDENILTPVSWVNGYQSAGCFHAVALSGNEQPVRVEGFSDRVDPFEDMDRRFTSAFGFEANFEVRLVTADQCPLVDFMHEAKGASPEIDMANDLINDANPMRASIAVPDSSGEMRFFVITPDAYMVDVTALARRTGERYDLTIDSRAFASTAGNVYLLLAMAAPTEQGVPLPAETIALSDALTMMENKGVAASIKYIEKRP